MSIGPIEFLGEEPTHEVPATEMGGEDGPIQPAKVDLLRGDPLASGGHVLDGRAVGGGVNSEGGNILHRAGNRPLSSAEAVSGVEGGEWAAVAGAQGMGADAVVDPLTGRALSPELNVDGKSARLSDLKPK